jgi:hypothetical protein
MSDAGDASVELRIEPASAEAIRAMLLHRSAPPKLTPEQQYEARRRALRADPVATATRSDLFVWAGSIETEFRGFSISTRAVGEYTPPYEISSGDSLLASTSDGARVFTGMYSGPAHITLGALDREPPAEPFWEETAELQLHTRYGVITVEDFAHDSVIAGLNLATAGPGGYRVRVSARGRSIAFDDIPTEPVEHYLVQVWPDEREPEPL